ncbi:MAG: PaaI family thioesterase [Acidimicrobiia bacterium]|nr:PaaI family thioesterase [Acidimicrobiia bacterium]
MAVRALEITAFGFPAACFVCDPTNPTGLRLSFVHDDEAHMVSSEFTLGPDFSGAPRFVHGGLVLTILDEAMAWAAISIAGRFAVTRTSKASFRRPVMVDKTHRVEAVVESHDEASVNARARVLNAAGKRCAEASARLVVLSPATARQAIGVDLGDGSAYVEAGYLRDTSPSDTVADDSSHGGTTP